MSCPSVLTSALYADGALEPDAAAAFEARWPQESVAPPDRPARGFAVAPEEMGLYEAGLWGSRYREAGQDALANRAYQRFSRLFNTK